MLHLFLFLFFFLILQLHRSGKWRIEAAGAPVLIQLDAVTVVDLNQVALSCLCCINTSQSLRRKRRCDGKLDALWDGCPRVRFAAGAAFCACVCGCARGPADSGTSTECLPFPQSFDVTRSRCDNEPCALPQGEHPAVCPGLCQSCGLAPLLLHHARTRAHTHTAVEDSYTSLGEA